MQLRTRKFIDCSHVQLNRPCLRTQWTQHTRGIMCRDACTIVSGNATLQICSHRQSAVGFYANQRPGRNPRRGLFSSGQPGIFSVIAGRHFYGSIRIFFIIFDFSLSWAIPTLKVSRLAGETQILNIFFLRFVSCTDKKEDKKTKRDTHACASAWKKRDDRSDVSLIVIIACVHATVCIYIECKSF